MPMYDRAMPSLAGASVLVAGGGLAGLAAAHDLVNMGAQVTVVDARDRVGGRVWTIRDGFADGQHAEAGGDLIEEEHHAVRLLAEQYGLTLTRILRSGWGYVRTNRQGVPTIARPGATNGWSRLAAALDAKIGSISEPYRLAEARWDTPITADLARRSVAAWLDATRADDEVRATATGLRSFFLADPEELSLIALIDQF